MSQSLANNLRPVHSARRFRLGRKASLFLIATACLAAFFWLTSPKEPQFKGKSLSSWLTDLDTERFDAINIAPMPNQDAAGVIYQIGEPAVPFLLSRLESGLAAKRRYFSLQKWPTKLPFKFLEKRLSDRMEAGNEAVFGFVALREKGAIAMPTLTAMLAANGSDSNEILTAMAATGSASLGVLSNSIQSSNMSLRRDSTRASGLLGKSGAPLVPLLISILQSTNQDDVGRSFAARALGKIGEPPSQILPALRHALTTTNGLVAGNVALGLMLLGESGRVAITDIETKLLNRDGQLNLPVALSLIVLSTNDDRVVAALRRVGGSKFSPKRPPAETFAFVRRTWTNCDVLNRREMFSMVSDLIPRKETD